MLKFLHREEKETSEGQIDLTQLKKILAMIPSNSAERYMEDGRPIWERWAKRFVDYYGRCSAAERTAIAQSLHEQFGKMNFIVPKDFHLLEMIWDFGRKSEHFPQLSSLFIDLIQRHQKSMTPDEFNALIHALKETNIFEKSLWEPYYLKREVPGRLTQARLQHAQHDATMERKLLLEKKLPDDPDDMVHMLKKMRKIKMDLPAIPDFFKLIQARFGATEQWGEIEKEMRKIESISEHQAWVATQIR